MKTDEFTGALNGLLASQRKHHRQRFLQAGACAAVAGAASVALLGVSGWFLAAASGVGLAGLVAVQSFNYLLPSAAVRLLAILRTGSRYGERLFGHDAALRSMAAVRPAVLRALCAAPAERALALGTGDATAVLMEDVAALEDRLVRGAAPWTAAAALAAGLILCALAGWAPVASTAACALAATLVSIGLQRGRRATAQALRHASGALKDELAMLAASVAELRCYGLEAWAVSHAAKHGEQLMQAQRRHATDAGRLDLMLAGITGLAAVLAIFLARGGGAPMAALAGLSAAMAIEGLAPLLRGALHLAIAERAAGRLDALLAEGDAAARSPMARVQSPASLELPLIPKTRLSPGARVAIVGPSGSGKTTLVETLLGLRRASPHVIRLGGVDIGQLDVAAVRDHFAWLPQDATLIAGTVRDNLALAWPDAADVEIWQALHDAALADRIRACPNGLDTWLGEDGALLSGGERRRLALARAYLRRAPWLLLDEPTEGLDLATEAVVLERLAGRLHRTGQGLLAVSHRARVVLLCDEVLRIGSGPRPRYSTREYSARAESA